MNKIDKFLKYSVYSFLQQIRRKRWYCWFCKCPWPIWKSIVLKSRLQHASFRSTEYRNWGFYIYSYFLCIYKYMQIICLYKSFTIQMSQVYIRELSSSVVAFLLSCRSIPVNGNTCDAVLVSNWIISIVFLSVWREIWFTRFIRFINNSNIVNDNQITYSH